MISLLMYRPRPMPPVRREYRVFGLKEEPEDRVELVLVGMPNARIAAR